MIYTTNLPFNVIKDNFKNFSDADKMACFEDFTADIESINGLRADKERLEYLERWTDKTDEQLMWARELLENIIETVRTQTKASDMKKFILEFIDESSFEL